MNLCDLFKKMKKNEICNKIDLSKLCVYFNTMYSYFDLIEHYLSYY